jgi:hypothetical protein
MLRKEVDYVPLSPKKSHIARLGIGDGVRQSAEARSVQSKTRTTRGGSEDIIQASCGGQKEKWDNPEENGDRGRTRTAGEMRRRTTEEKKEILGGMLGNVDALVESVTKAGIWGLG